MKITDEGVEVKGSEIDELVEELLDAQQDINLAANSHMDQSLCDASALIDKVEAFLLRIRSALVDVPAVESEPVADPEPIAWYLHLWNEADEDIKSDVRWGQPTADEIERAEHNGHDIEYLYGSHPPRSLSNEGTMTMNSLRAQAIEDVLSALTAHELYRYRPKAFEGFIKYARAALVGEEEGRLWRDEQSQSKVLNAWIDVNDRLPGEQGEDSEEVSVFLNGHCGLLDHDKRQGGGWGYRTGFYDAARQCFRVHGVLDQFVTHWQPLPSAPPSTRKGSSEGDGSATATKGHTDE